MSRLTDPDSGVTVSVDEDYAKQLTALGWKPATESKPARKASVKSTEK